MRTRLISPRRTVLDGVPTYYAAIDGPFTATLAFRVGRADETLLRSGLTHLIEHLAMPIEDAHALEANATVEPSLTVFYATGPRETVLEFIEGVAESLGSLPLDRVETELRILKTEAWGRDRGPLGLAFQLRFGTRGYGQLGHDEYGLNTVGRDDVLAWSGEWFTRENAVLWMSGKPPRTMRLALPSGARRPPPEPAPIPYLPFPCVYEDRSADYVALICLAERSTELTVATGIGHRRLRRQLRYESGLSYSVDFLYEPLTAATAHISFVADLLEAHAETARDLLVETLTELAREGPTREELDRETEETRRVLADPYSALGMTSFAALNELFGRPQVSPHELLRRHESTTPESAAAALCARTRELTVDRPGRRRRRHEFRAVSAGVAGAA